MKNAIRKIIGGATLCATLAAGTYFATKNDTPKETENTKKSIEQTIELYNNDMSNKQTNNSEQMSPDYMVPSHGGSGGPIINSGSPNYEQQTHGGVGGPLIY